MIPSLRVRYVQKLVASGIALGLSLVSILLLPRSFSPEELGGMDLVTTIGTSIFNALAFGIPAGYINWTARHGPKGAKAGIKLLTQVLIALGIIVFLMLLVARQCGALPHVFPDIPTDVIFFGLGLAWLTFVQQTCGQIFDALGITKESEILKVVQSILRAAFCATLFYYSVLKPVPWLMSQSLVLLLITVAYIWFWQRRSFAVVHTQNDATEFSKYIRQFVGYFSFLTIFTFVYEVGDRLILQLFGGSAQQGYFSLAQRLANILMLFTVAFVPILQRDFAYEAERGNIDRLRVLLERNKLFISLVSIIAIFASVFSHHIVGVIGGKAFEGSIPIFMIMSLYPIHQTMGQLTNFLLVSAGQQRLYAWISNLFLVVSLASSYLVLAPQSAQIPGLELGGTGFALKLFLLQLVFNNIYLYHLCKFTKANYMSWFRFQLQGPACFFICALAALFIVNHFGTGHSNPIAIAGGAALYSVGVMTLLHYRPKWFGLFEGELNALKTKAAQFFRQVR